MIFMFMQYVIGCQTEDSPPENLTAQEGLCNGIGCCQVALSSNIAYQGIYFRDDNTSNKNISGTDDTKHCQYAMVVETERFKFSTAYLNTTTFWDENNGEVPIILNWAVGNKTCDVAEKDAASYACRSSKSECIDSTSRLGYLCNCSEGYKGNPYLDDGCQGL